MDYLYIPDEMRYGPARRRFIVDWFRAHPDGRYAVNCKYRPQLHHDPDLRKLLKAGVLKQVREGGGRRCHMNKQSFKRLTVLALAAA